MQKAIRILEFLMYIFIGAIGGRAIAHKDWTTLIMAIILLALVVFFALIHDTCFEEKEDGRTD